jgi:uncharacterized protein YodC (DUF2158 family)
MTKCKPGDVVRIVDGPTMTVESVTGKKAQCVWFEGAYVHRDSFAVVALVAVGGAGS